MNESKFRCHFTIIIEKMWKSFFVLVFAFFTGIFNNLPDITVDYKNSTEDAFGILFFILLILVVFIISFIYHTLIWYKTYISIENNAIVIDKNTLNHTKNNIGIQNISNINTEQNVFEMLFHTCTVKLDTNSLSTANKTDVKIVLKKEDAENFQRKVMEIMQKEIYNNQENSDHSPKEGINYDIEASGQEIVLHGLYSLNLISVLVFWGCLISGIIMLQKLFLEDTSWANISSILVSFFTTFIFLVSSIKDILNRFIKFYNFKAARIKDKLYLQYGLFKKVNYTIPTDKINAIHIKQSFLARLFGMYTIELINVGMGDDEGSKSAFLLLYCKKSQIKQRLFQLLPEFLDTIDINTVRQPRRSWIPRLFNLFIFSGFFIGGTFITNQCFFPIPWQFGIGVGTLYFLLILTMICSYFTAGLLMSEQYLTITHGCFKKTYTCIKYEKVQFVRLKQTFLTKKLGITKGHIFLLANTSNQTHVLPYFYESETKKLKQYCCES